MRVIVRPPSRAFRRALSTHPERERIDPGRALQQHRTFVSSLQAAGLDVLGLPPVAELPDACFVSDTLVALPAPGDPNGPAALLVLTRPGAPSRREEVETVATGARRLVPADATVIEISEPGTLDGGDVIVFGDRVAIGVSERSNEQGGRQLAEAVRSIGYRPFLCPVPDRLHLATAVSVLRPDRLIGTRAGYASLDAAGPGVAPPDEIDRVLIPDQELPAANVLAIGGRCFLAQGHPRAVAQLRMAGEAIVEVELDEFTRADGGPTCLVAIIP